MIIDKPRLITIYPCYMVPFKIETVSNSSVYRHNIQRFFGQHKYNFYNMVDCDYFHISTHFKFRYTYIYDAIIHTHSEYTQRAHFMIIIIVM